MGRVVHALALFCCVAMGCVVQAQERRLEVTCTLNTSRLTPYDVLELSFQHENNYANPFFDVTLEVTFISPRGREVRIGGFHYGSTSGPRIVGHVVPGPHGERRQYEYVYDRHNLWKARFAPTELGRWRFRYTFTNRNGESATGTGVFECVKGRVPNHGFLRPHRTNPFRWVFDDGTPYFPIGLQECVGDGFGAGTWLAAMSLEGPFRTDRQGRPALPPGGLFMPGPSTNPHNGDVYFRTYGRAGFNLFRFSQANCSPNLYHDLDHYLVHEAVMTDDLLACVRKYGFRIMYGIFGYQPVLNDQPDNAEGMAKLKRFVKYSVDRWGAYVDIWEFLNEQNAADAWYAQMTPYLRSIDPYAHPITTSWERPHLPGIDVNAPHWYQCEDEHESDAVTAARAQEWKRAGKPVIVGEQGNYVDPQAPRPPGVGGVWDERSALRMRLRNWTALFNEIAFIFWNTSYARDGHFMNIWLGPQERQYVKAMQDFAACLDADVRVVPVTVSDPQTVRAYGLASGGRAAVYLHHYSDHQSLARGIRVTLDVPRRLTAYWYSPENGAILGSTSVAAGHQTLTAPDFQVDLALLLTSGQPPDSDRDGRPNHIDPDDDGDGVLDVRDAFPLDPSEWADRDGDLIGDNIDADDDADGVGDDQNRNGIPDFEEMDLDGDGVPQAKTVPWDAFPLDPKEWRDTDGDGIGDNADPDDDGDGWSDAAERRARTNPLDRLSFPRR